MQKPRVVFPYVEAGLGHIMPLNSIADEFERLYGDRVEVVRSRFFTETGSKKLASYERHLTREVVKHNRHPFYGWFSTFCMDFFGTKLSSWGAIKVFVPGSYREGVRHMDELKPDLVFSTHWCTNYYARRCKSRPLTVVYVPDAHVNTLFRYDADLVLVSMSTGYERALIKHPRRFDESNLALVPFLIRKEAYDAPASKAEARRKLGFPEDKFTVSLAEGGYGIGRMREICERVLERDIDVTLAPICGKNTELFERFSRMKSKGKTDFRPFGLTDRVFDILAASDLFCGKSGASMAAEPCFFGVPQIVTKYATEIEKYIGEYYIDVVGSAIKEFDPGRVADLIERYASELELLQPYAAAARAAHSNYGPTVTAKKVFDLLASRFPDLKSGLGSDENNETHDNAKDTQ